MSVLPTALWSLRVCCLVTIRPLLLRTCDSPTGCVFSGTLCDLPIVCPESNVPSVVLPILSLQLLIPWLFLVLASGIVVFCSGIASVSLEACTNLRCRLHRVCTGSRHGQISELLHCFTVLAALTISLLPLYASMESFRCISSLTAALSIVLHLETVGVW